MKIIECIPNISEGKDIEKIKAITNEAKSTAGAYLLDVYTGASTNRTVLTLAGNPKAIKEAIYKTFKKTSELIDMRKHKGVHPRIGSVDVCPFIPVRDMTIEECIDITREVGQKVAEELDIPVYLYGESAAREERKDLSNIREGGYEKLKEKLKNPEWKPDFGEAKFNEKSGASIIGARDFLIAFNINLKTKETKLANVIAEKIRESGTVKVDNNGNKVRVPGTLKEVKAIGWYIEEFGCAQVSTNLIDFRVTPLHRLFEEVEKEAKKLGVEVAGSELVGLVPEEALLNSGKFYLARESSEDRSSKNKIINTAINYLGLSSRYEFFPEEKIMEYKMKKEML
ncbi:glutamate formimidoyltransferase [candidate division WOR-3 bacterium]|nr:glutamate formimidoyltransferase [candidate division WOR-3 bacterium]